MVIDTHCHLNIVEEKGIKPVEALNQATRAGVNAVIEIATDLNASMYNLNLADNLPANSPVYYWTAGLHPEAADEIEQLPRLLDFIRENYKRTDFIAIGETGLDYFHSTEYEKEQKKSLEAHLDLALELGMPVVIHTRDDRQYVRGSNRSVMETLERVQDRPGLMGVLHCFTYSSEEARPFVDLGWMVSFSGILTFKNSHVLHKAALDLPLECIMVETDAPFLSPVPHRGKTNQPAYVADTLEFLAKHRAENLHEDPDEVKAVIYENSKRFIHTKERNRNA